MKIAEIIEENRDKNGNNNSMNSSFVFPGEEEPSNNPEVRKKNSLDIWRTQKKHKQ